MPDDVWNPPENPYEPVNPDTKRWSYHLANDPYGGAAGAWAKQYYDNPNIDPNSAIQSQLGAFRQRYGSDAPEDDITALQYIATRQAPPSKKQSPAEQWTSTASSGPVGNTGNELLQLLMQRARQGTAIGGDNPNVRAHGRPVVGHVA